MLCVVYGGSGSGKSEYAEELAVKLRDRYNAEDMYYIAAMKPYGEEGRRRVRRHRELRQGKGFVTIEKYCGIKDADIRRGSVVLLECMSNLAANEMFDCGNKNAETDILDGVRHLNDEASALVIVTNDIFSGGTNYSPEIIGYMKLLADINRNIAAEADMVFEIINANAVKLKG